MTELWRVQARPRLESRSGKALLMRLETGDEVWVPKSLIHDDSEVWKMDQDEGELVLPLWWAEKEGLA